jgi:hypothetical protein
MENSKGVLLWLAMMTAQIWWAIILFWGHSKAPKWFKITLWVLLVLNFLAIIGLTQ